MKNIVFFSLYAFAISVGISLSAFFVSLIYWIYKLHRKSDLSPDAPPCSEAASLIENPSGFFRSIFHDFPKMIISDYYSRIPDSFPRQGMICFTGRQGSGKTISMVHQVRQWLRSYPRVLVLSNLGFSGESQHLDSWEPLIDIKNGVYGVIAAIDELQNWFSSASSRNFPPEMLQVITQNRKNRRVILGTSQVFSRLAKPLREQVTEVRECHTLFKCLTFVHCKEPLLDAEGNVIELRHIRWYWFVHSDQLRDSYDTYKVIESLRKSGMSGGSLSV